MTPTPRIPLNEPQPVVRRDLYDVLVERLDTEAENWPPYPMEISPGFPPVPTAMLPATIAEQIIEDWLQKTYLPAIEREAQAIPLIDVDLLTEALRCCNDVILRGPADHIGPHVRDEYARLASESSTAEEQRCRVPDCPLGGVHSPPEGAALPVKEGEPE